MLLLFLLLPFGMIAQPALQFSTAYLHAPAWDKIIRTYNFARPWSSDKATPLTYGYAAAASWNWRIQSSREIHLLPEIAYTWWYDVSENEAREVRLGIHSMQIGMSLRMHPKCLFKDVQGAGPIGTRFYLGLGGGLTAFLPYKKINQTLVKWKNDEVYREFSFAPYLQLSAGYHLTVIGSFAITPELAVQYFPSAELKGFAEVVNGHNLMGLKNTASPCFFLRGGLRITFLKKKANWWDRPRAGDKT